MNTLTPDEKYFPCNREKLPKPIQMQLYKKLNIFSKFFTRFLKFKTNFKHLKKKRESHSLRLCEIIDCEIPAEVNF